MIKVTTISHWGTDCLCAIGRFNEQPMVTLWNTLVQFKDAEFQGEKPLLYILQGIEKNDMLDDFLRRTNYEDFLKVLPQLRLAFSFFTPAEMDRLAGKVAGKYGLRGKEFAELKEVDAEEYSYGKALEERILQKNLLF